MKANLQLTAVLSVLSIATSAASAANLVANGGFESNAVFTNFPGYITGNAPINNWNSNANTGIGLNPGSTFSPFADNGTIPEGSRVAFVQSNGGTSILDQTVTGLAPGYLYQISARLNARSSGVPNAAISFGGEELYTNQGIYPVGGSNPYGSAVFYRYATSANEALAFQNSTGGDTTLLVDDVQVNPFQNRILYQDNFNSTTGPTTDLNSDIARTTGDYAGTTYTMAGGAGAYGHQLQNGAAVNQLLLADAGLGVGTVSLNHNFNGIDAQQGMRIAFDIDPNPAVYGNGDTSLWGSINLGLDPGNQLEFVNGAGTHFGILFRQSGQIEAFDGSTDVSGSIAYSSTANGMRHVELLLTDTDGNPFDGVGNTTIQVFGDINNFSSPIYTYTKVGGYANNFINLQGLYRSHFDNLTIMRVPEPSSIVMLGMGVAGLFGLKRRQRAAKC